MRDEVVSCIREDPQLLENASQSFEDFLRNFSQPDRKNSRSIELHPVEKSILVDMLTKENK